MRYLTLFLVLAFLSPTSALAQDPGNGWLLITTPGLRESFEPLAALRREQGYKVSVVTDWNGGSGVDEQVQTITEEIEKFKESTEPNDATYVLIGGAHLSHEDAEFVPTTLGTHGRMKDRPTDHYYSLPNEQGVAAVILGRLPARNSEEARAMVSKTIRAESKSLTGKAPDSESGFSDSGLKSPHLSLIIANPGGETKIEKKLGETFLRSIVKDRLDKFDPELRVEVVADIRNSKFASKQDFGAQAINALTSGSIFTIYCGHSSAAGLWSESRYVVPREQFAVLKSKRSRVFLSCGCFTCQVDKPRQIQVRKPDGSVEQTTIQMHGFGIEAIRNPHGPATVIGPFGESYSVFGKLAMDAIFHAAQSEDQPTTVGGYWRAVQLGLAQGKIDALRFFFFDQADGSGGKTSFAQQQPEHVEMWTLLGDPAMKLPALPNSKKAAEATSQE